jgi:hypothetical protein
MDPAISICPAVAAPGRPRCSNTPFGVMVKSASKLAAAVYIVAAYVADAAGSPHRLAAAHGGQAELATVRFPKPKPMTAAVTNRDLKVNANRLIALTG